MPRLPAALVLALACVQAPAQPVKAPPVDPCAEADNTIEVNECAAKVLKARDAELNRAYQDLLAQLRPDPGVPVTGKTDYATIRKELAEAQRAWVRFRDNDCNATYHYWFEGTARNIRYLTCMINRTEQRTRELKDWARI